MTEPIPITEELGPEAEALDCVTLEKIGFQMQNTQLQAQQQLTQLAGQAALIRSQMSGVNYDGSFRMAVGTVAQLPAASGALEGSIRGVTDALLPAALAVVAAGGAVHCAVYCNGTNWIVL